MQSLQPTSKEWNSGRSPTVRVTCAVPLATIDGRALIAVGCAEGVWVGVQNGGKPMRQVLHLKNVTQCAVLEEVDIFLVLANKALFACHIDMMVASSPPSTVEKYAPQQISLGGNVSFFKVGSREGRTVVIYMKKKWVDSIFFVLHPVAGKIKEKAEVVETLRSRLGLRPPRSEWFREDRIFFVPSSGYYDIVLLKNTIVLLRQKGFEVVDLFILNRVAIPRFDDPCCDELAKRCKSCRPIGMSRVGENEYLLCYNEFGLYTDRQGCPIRSRDTIRWEVTAQRVAWHPPYVHLSDSEVTEIRRIDTGELCDKLPLENELVRSVTG